MSTFGHCLWASGPNAFPFFFGETITFSRRSDKALTVTIRLNGVRVTEMMEVGLARPGW